jgi:TolB-like protein
MMLGIAAAVAVAVVAIAVLPFVNMSSDKEQEHFADGLSEELLNQLAQIPKLRVIADTFKVVVASVVSDTFRG